MKKLIFTIAVALLATATAKAQQDPHYSLYIFNQLPYNAATTADREVPTLNAQYRNQWLGLDGAPKTMHLNFQTPFGGNRNGFGLALTGDRIGMTGMNSVAASYAYRFKVSEKMKLSLGVQASLDQFRIDWPKARPLDQDDQEIAATANTETGGNFGVGGQLAGSRFYLGAAMPKLIPTKLYSDEYLNSNSKSIIRTLYLTAGYRISLTEKIDFLPAALVVVNKHEPFELELAGQLLFSKKFGAGLNYRHGDSLDAFLMYKITEKLRAGFAWDFTTSQLRSVNNGSFELMLGYQFRSDEPKKCQTIEDVRFF